MYNLSVLKSTLKFQNNKQKLTHNLQKLLPLALGILSISFAPPVGAQERALRTLTVSGRGVESIAATLTQMDLGVEVQGKNANEVQQELGRRSTAVVNFLRSQNVDKLQTSGIRLVPVYEYGSRNNTQELKFYRGINTVSFQVTPDRSGQILEGAVQAGATVINGVGFTASDAALTQAQQQALRLATQDAQRQADTVLAALNLTRQDVVNIQINNATFPRQMLLREEMITGGSTDYVPQAVIPGEQKVEASVTLTISY